jgi:hypothetical protein
MFTRIIGVNQASVDSARSHCGGLVERAPDILSATCELWRGEDVDEAPDR